VSVFDKMTLDHIGVAVNSIEESSQFYRLLGVTDIPIEEVASEKVRVGVVSLQNQVDIELIEAMTDGSPIAKFLKKKGPGLHHICLRVENLLKTLNELKAQGVRLISDEPKKGAHNCLIAFVHPESAGGILIELSQKMEE